MFGTLFRTMLESFLDHSKTKSGAICEEILTYVGYYLNKLGTMMDTFVDKFEPSLEQCRDTGWTLHGLQSQVVVAEV